MDWNGRIVFITGASSGIGAACARAFGRAGARLLLAARRRKRLSEVAAEAGGGIPGRVLELELDVRDERAVARALAALPEEWSAIDVLINNAGLSRGLAKLHEGELADWEEMIDTNVKGLLYVTRAVLPGMVARGRGHVINLGSIAGHESYPGGNVYCASKAAVKALTSALRMDLVDTPIRVSTIDPGLVETEFSLVRFHGDAARAAQVYQGLEPLTANDVAEVLLLPTAQASATVVHRRP